MAGSLGLSYQEGTLSVVFKVDIIHFKDLFDGVVESVTKKDCAGNDTACMENALMMSPMVQAAFLFKSIEFTIQKLSILMELERGAIFPPKQLRLALFSVLL